VRTGLIILLALVGILVIAVGVAYWKLKSLLSRSREKMQSALSEIGGEIESYHEKTQ
jgi:Tfp pilus assembly protein PilE